MTFEALIALVAERALTGGSLELAQPVGRSVHLRRSWHVWLGDVEHQRMRGHLDQLMAQTLHLGQAIHRPDPHPCPLAGTLLLAGAAGGHPGPQARFIDQDRAAVSRDRRNCPVADMKAAR